MILKRNAPEPQKSWAKRWLRAGAAVVASASAAVALTTGCLDRPVSPAEPQTSNIYVAEIRQTAVDKIDLLFMIDNSVSMSDKQTILREAVPVLVTRLVTPACVDGNGNPTGDNVENGRCARGEAEFSPIKDIHIGIVTSSLGAHGGQVCSGTAGRNDDDQARLVGTVRPNLPSWNGSGFLAWDPAGRKMPMPGEANAETLIRNFQNMVAATGEVGCGFEASMESWYRFLIDPQPPARVFRTGDDGNAVTAVEGIDQVVLDQRKAFLRPDSLVAIIMLTDENDCSIRDEGQSWLVGLQTFGTRTPPDPFRMPKSTSQCATNPNDPCCRSCNAGADPTCGDPKSDSVCAAGSTYTQADDQTNLRCYDQQRRFGFDLLHPIERYVDGLTQRRIRDRQQVEVDNPLFAEGVRDPSLIFLAGIVGVPWQDIATQASLDANAGLEYLTYSEMEAQGRWDWILGTPGTATAAPGIPRDGLMLETPLDRSAMNLPPHPALNVAIQRNGSPDRHPINGFETLLAGDIDPRYRNSDLQYACIFPLRTPVTCSQGVSGCDCNETDSIYNRALCQGTQQRYAKAYPGVRHLRLLKAFGERTQNSIVASICPKKTTAQGDPAGDPNYGYNPAVAAIIDRLKEALRGKCLPRPLDIETDGPNAGKVPCSVVEASAPPAGQACAPCVGNPMLPGRADPAAAIRPSVQRQLSEAGYCGDQQGQIKCADFCLCEIQQFSEQGPLNRCQTEGAPPTDIHGYCYIDPAAWGPGQQDIAMRQQALVASCPETQKRLLRFTGDNVPAKGAVAMIACLGASVTGSDSATAP